MDKYLDQLSRLNTQKEPDGRPKPHKAILLMSILDMIENGELRCNKIEINDQLHSHFKSNWSKYVRDGRAIDKSLVKTPFEHMGTTPFWKAGLMNNEATIDQCLFSLLQITENIEKAKNVLYDKYLNNILDLKNADDHIINEKDTLCKSDNGIDSEFSLLSEIADTIEGHVNLERIQNVANRAIGGAKIILDKEPKNIWVLNREIKRTSIIQRDITAQIRGTEVGESVDVINSDGTNTSKNSYWGRIILENFMGEYDFVDRQKRKHLYSISNSFTYDSTNTQIKNLRVGCEILGGFRLFENISQLKEKYSSIKQTEELKRASEAKANNILEKKEQIRIEAEKAIHNAKSQAEARELKQKQNDDEAKIKQEYEKEQERIVELEKERLELEKSLHSDLEHYKNAVKFIREQATLRNNPVLDKRQNQIKFSHLFDNTTLVIDGGPGTGKTTTLIQRLKLLISRYDLEDYISNTSQFNLREEHLNLLTDEKANWMFFSPTESLCKYLRSNMEYEGLINPGDKTKVWSSHLQYMLRDYYHLAGSEKQFDFRKKDLTGKTLYLDTSLKLVEQFINQAYLMSIRTRIYEFNHVDYSSFEWKYLGESIKSIREKARAVSSIDQLIRLLFEIERLKDLSLPNSSISVKSIIENCNVRLNRFSTSLMVQIRKDEELNESLNRIVSSWITPEYSEEDLEEDFYDNDDTTRVETKLNNSLKSLIRVLSLRVLDPKLKLNSRNLQLFDMIEHLIAIDDLKYLSEQLYFTQYVYPPFLRNPESLLLNSIPAIYKRYRKSALESNQSMWNTSTLKLIVEKHKNRSLHQDEQSFLLGFINNIVLSIRKISKSKFDNSKNRYVEAYKNCCRPIIGIDEATDYSIYDYYAISSLKHYLISSVTLTGDIMQCLNENGISEWDNIKRAEIFKSLDVHQLSVSYRQSPELLKLADYIYERVMKTNSPYKCSLSGEDNNIPKPLWYIDEDTDNKIEWIISRILEVQKAYGFVPSIAVFASTKEEVSEIVEFMKDSDELDTAGIDVVDCSNGLTEALKDQIRIYPIDMVKGMEFEVAFFHNLHNIDSMPLLDRYLYVGLSRASFYFGVTSSNELCLSIGDLIHLFDTDGNWGL